MILIEKKFSCLYLEVSDKPLLFDLMYDSTACGILDSGSHEVSAESAGVEDVILEKLEGKLLVLQSPLQMLCIFFFVSTFSLLLLLLFLPCYQN